MKNITVCGFDIREFSVYCADKISCDNKVIKSKVCAEKLSELLSLTISEEMGDGKYIVVSASSTDVNSYSVKISEMKIEISGSFLSVDRAFEGFLKLIEEKSVLCEGDSFGGSLELGVPYNKDDLYRLFETASESDKMIISGTHAYQVGKEQGKIGSTLLQTKEKCGEFPAIIEIDLGLHSVYFDFHYKGDTISPYDLSVYVSECLEHASKGGIISVCIHMSNPLNNAKDKVWYRGKLGSDELAREMLTEGTELHGALRKTLESTFMLLKALKQNGIPFMFRPLHEMNGGWFWWCVNQGGDIKLQRETMADFWKFFYKVVSDELEIKDVLWVYSPNYNTGSCADVLYAYPGDEYVDIVGCDWYTCGNYEVNNNNSYSGVMSTGKISALTEVGPASGGPLAIKNEEGKIIGYNWTCLDLLSSMKRMLSDGFKISYFLTWTGKGSIAGLGDGDVLMKDDLILTRDDIMKKFWKK